MAKDNLALMYANQKALLEQLDGEHSKETGAEILEILDRVNRAIADSEKARAEQARIVVEERKSKRSFLEKMGVAGVGLAGTIVVAVKNSDNLMKVLTLEKDGFLVASKGMQFVSKIFK